MWVVFPVAIMSMSTIPVSGSVADLRVAKLIKSIAYSASSADTSVDSRILAKASLSLIIDSSSRGVADMVLKLCPSALSRRYSFCILSAASSPRTGWIFLAKLMKLDRV